MERYVTVGQLIEFSVLKLGRDRGSLHYRWTEIEFERNAALFRYACRRNALACFLWKARCRVS